jgi:phage terminase large subunit-like protein
MLTRAGRVEATKRNPELFAWVYLRHHLRHEDGPVTWGRHHERWYSEIRSWVEGTPEPRSYRRGYVAPRSSSKTTTWFLIAPLWASAHGWAKFVVAFADSGTQAEIHLDTFKRELENNALLRADFPELCAPATGERSRLVSNNRTMTIRENDFVFAAKGADSSSLGLKVGNRRPDVIILDDIEPDASNYSQYQAAKRQSTLINAILPLNLNARVIWSGTVTMEGSLIHQLVKTVTAPKEDIPSWITDENFTVDYQPAIYLDDDGVERSIWPGKWPIEELLSWRHTISFALNFMNEPIGDGGFWTVDDIKIIPETVFPRTIISIDPAVTKKNTSDFTGVALLSYNKPKRRMWVRRVWKVKKSPRDLRHLVAAILQQFPEVTVLLVETNQGGDTWEDIFSGLDVKYREIKQDTKKEVRAVVLLNGYQKREVVHAEKLPALDAELLAFPTGLNDDLLDAVGSGYAYFTGAEAEKMPRPGKPRQLSYV